MTVSLLNFLGLRLNIYDIHVEDKGYRIHFFDTYLAASKLT